MCCSPRACRNCMRCKRIWRMLYILPSALETQTRVYSERLPGNFAPPEKYMFIIEFSYCLQVSAQEQTTMATTTTTSSTTTTTTTSKRYLSNFLTAEAESTLSNVTSIHTQLQSQSQSLYETQNSAQLKALDKHSALLQELHQRQLQSVPRSVTDAAASGGAGGGAAAASGTKTATILVSKSKTKTGLPLLLKNSINN